MLSPTETAPATEGLEPPFVQHNGRRDYMPWYKSKVVQESLKPGASISGVARSHNINSNVLFRWRAEHRKGTLKKPATGAPAAPAEFIAVGVIGKDGRLLQSPKAAAPEKPLALPVPVRSAALPSPIEFELPSGIKVRFDAGVNLDLMRRALAVAKELK
jgi:transposase